MRSEREAGVGTTVNDRVSTDEGRTYASWSFRVMPYCSATASLVNPIGRRQSRASSDGLSLMKGEMSTGIARVCEQWQRQQIHKLRG